MLCFRLAIAAIILGGGWYIKILIADNAVKDQALINVTAAMADYAHRTESEVEAYRISTEILSREYQAERKIRNDKFASIENRDLDKMAKRKPKALSRILTGRTRGLLDSLANASAGTRNTEATTTPKTGADDAQDD